MARGFRHQFSSAQLKAMQRAAAQVKNRVYGFVSAVVDDIPVDTGALRGGWQIGKTGQPMISDTPLDPTGAATKALLIRKIRYLPIHMDWDIWFGNGKPYASVIEYEGHSKQAPNGMLRRNIARGGEGFNGFQLGSFK